MNKLYQRINWQNYPSDSTPLNESNLNKMDAAVDGIDDRVVTLDVTKLPVSTANTMVKDVTFNESTGVFTITKLNGTKVTVNTALEKIATNFRFDHSTQKLILTLIDGTTQEVDLSALLTQYEFLNSSTIQFTIDSSGKVKASVVNGSITGDMLEPNYLANVTLQASKADTSAKNAKESEEKASEYAENAKNSADSAEPVASTATGTNPIIQDSTNAPLIYGKFKGYTKQQMYSGKNIVNLEKYLIEKGAIYSKNGNKYTISINTNLYNNIYRFSENDIEVTVSCVYSNISSTNPRIDLVNANNKIVTEITPGTVIVTATASAFRFNFGDGGDITVDNFQIERGTTATPYEPYVGGIVSPNPDYSQSINGLAKDGAIEVKTCGKNIFGGLALAQALVDSGSTNVVLDTDAKTVTFGYNENYETKFILFKGNFKENTQYSFVLNGTHTNCGIASDYYSTNLCWQYTDGTRSGMILNDTGSLSEVVKSDANKSVESLIYIWVEANDILTLNYEQCGIFEGVITADEFEPYTETTAAIPTDPLYEGDYLEIYADGSGKLVRAMTEVVFDETHGYSVVNSANSTGDTIYFEHIEPNNLYKNNNLKCDKLINQNIWSTDVEGIVYEGSSASTLTLRFRIKKSRLVSADVAGLKAWLAENPLRIVIEKAEPTETPLTAEQVAQFKKLYSFEPVTSVLCDGEVEMRYYKANVNGETVGMLQEQTKDFAKKAIYGDTTINVGRKADTTVGDYSSAIGAGTTASGYASLAEGFYTTAENTAAHAEGSSTKASGLNSHAEGFNTNALESNSHAEGCETIASGLDSHAEGNTTTASGEDSHAEGNNSKAIGAGSHAEGYFTTASGLYSHTEGNSTTASGNNSHAEGQGTKALGDNSHAEGRATQALQNQHAQGHYNDTSLATMNSDSGTSNGTAFVIGNGGVGSLSNAFRITGKGAVYAKEAYNATGADYAEFSEWADGNPNNEDRRGYFVTFDDEKPNMIRKANAGEYILGIVSGNPCIIGNADEGWLGRYVFDDFGGIIYEDKEVEETYIDEETGEEKTRLVQITTYKENPDYDPTQKYIHREQRQEWAAVGWIGVLSVRDDNTCIPSGYCKVTDGGIATAAERGTDTYRVLERVTDNIIKIVLK